MLSAPLACTVGDCGLLLERDERALKCARGHSYDVARSGYINLLQPHDRRSLAAGDAKEAVAARARLLEAGIGSGSLLAAVARATALDLPERPVVVDLGSGTGHLLATLAARRPIAGIGIDLSVAAAEHAARKYPELSWVVANADRRLPLLDRSVDLALSLHGRRNAVECARVLTRPGFVLVTVPAADDLIELRALVLGQPIERPRIDALVAEYETWFTVIERTAVREHRALNRGALQDLLRTTYRGARRRLAHRVDALATLDVTLASDMLLFGRR